MQINIEVAFNCFKSVTILTTCCLHYYYIALQCLVLIGLLANAALLDALVTFFNKPE